MISFFTVMRFEILRSLPLPFLLLVDFPFLLQRVPIWPPYALVAAKLYGLDEIETIAFFFSFSFFSVVSSFAAGNAS